MRDYMRLLQTARQSRRVGISQIVILAEHFKSLLSQLRRWRFTQGRFEVTVLKYIQVRKAQSVSR